MKLSIVTINYNNAEELKRTLASVASQTYRDIEHIIVDGGSTDGSVDVIKEYENTIKQSVTIDKSTIQVKWISEPDKGIYNAMNKGIEIALGRRVVSAGHTSSPNSLNAYRSSLNVSPCDYIQILNSGDILAAPDVTEHMMEALNSLSAKRSTFNEDAISILYGNMIKKDYATGKMIGKSGEEEYSLCNLYTGTLNHDCCYIHRKVYETYGLYDENLKIVSDWKWFVQVIGLGKVTPIYVDIDVTIFDCSGISEQNVALRNKERRMVLEEIIPPAILNDFEQYAFPIEQYKRLRKYHLWGFVYFIERVLFKLNKWKILR